jgi:DNA-binding CsgD family transcriptional regulator
MAPHPFIEPLPSPLVATAREGLLTLLPGEARVFREMLNGRSMKDIAKLLDITPRTVDTQMGRVTAKCGCSRFELIRICCFDLVADDELFDILRFTAARYPATRAL